MNKNLRLHAVSAGVLGVLAVLTMGAVALRSGGALRADAAPAPAARAAITVDTTQPTPLLWPTLLPADGRVAAWQEAVIGAEVGSLRITALNADVGQTVKRGQLLALLADDGLRAGADKQRALVAQARANLAQAQANVARARTVSASGVLSGQKIDGYLITEATSRAALASAEAELRSVEIQIAQTRIVAVDDGLVSSRSALLGNVVASGTELFRLVRQGRIEWQAEVDAQRIGALHVGQTARVVLADGRTVEGQVRLIAPTLSPATHRALVYVRLPAGSGAQPGMFASGTIEGAPQPALTLPQSAVVLRDGRSDVYLLKADDRGDATVTRRTVTTGRRIGDRVEVLSGLDAGAQVVAAGGAFLADGVRVERAGAVIRGDKMADAMPTPQGATR